MRLHPDFPIINQVDSVLISQKIPTKLLLDTNILMESKYVDDSYESIFTEPSKNILQKLNKLAVIDPISCGKDSNSNIRAFVMTSLQFVFNFAQTSYQEFFIEKIGNGFQSSTKANLINNHSIETLPLYRILRNVVGFLRTLTNKKLKNPDTFNLRNEFQQHPMMLDDFIMICRSILSHFGVQNASDSQKKIKDNDTFTILSKYFDINLTKKKQNFYIFEDEMFFIYKDSDEYIIGKFSEMENKEKEANQLSIRKQSIGSFANINTKDRDKLYSNNIKFHYNHKQKVSEYNHMEKAMNSERNPVNLHLLHDKNESFKNLSTDRNYIHLNDGVKENDHIMLTGQSHTKITQKVHFNERINSPSHFNSFIHDKTFEWKNQDSKLRKAETICHKTCQTCHRKFYKNEIQSNVMEVKIIVEQKPKEANISQNPIPTTLYFKNAPDFLNKKFNKKPLQGLLDSPQSKELRLKTLQNQIEKQNTNSERSFQFNWLSKRQRIVIEKQKVQCENFPLSPKQVHSKTENEQINKFQSTKKSMSIHNLFLLANQNQQKSRQKILYTPKQTGKSKTKQNRKLSTDSSDLSLKPKYFSALRSSKQLLSIKSKQKFVFNKSGEQHKALLRPTTDGKMVKEKALQNTNNSNIKDSIHKERRATLNEKTRERVGSSDEKEISPNNQCSESIEKKMPRFIGKKKSLKTQLKLIMNN